MIAENGWPDKRSYSTRANQRSIQTTIVSNIEGLTNVSIPLGNSCLSCPARHMPIHVRCLKVLQLISAGRNPSPSIEWDPCLTGHGEPG